MNEIDFTARYRHRRRGFEALVASPEWWDVAPKDVRRDLVVVHRLGLLTGGPTKWVMPAKSFIKLYAKVSS